jgi:MFS family permease
MASGIVLQFVPMHDSIARTVWKTIALSAMCLVGIGLAAFSIDEVSIGQFDLIEGHYEAFGLAILIGLACLLIGLIGWAALLDKAGRARVAAFALALPPVILVVTGLSTGANIHGVFPLYLLSLVPVMFVGFIVAIMAAKAPRSSRESQSGEKDLEISG